jgi:hypothetical protein
METALRTLIRIDTAHYGWVVSRHRTTETAEAAYQMKAQRILRRTPGAVVNEMYVISAVVAPLRQRVRYA